jgi:hypothetical protein
MITNFNRRPNRRKIEIFTNSDKFLQLSIKQNAKPEIPYFSPSASFVDLSRPLSALNLNISKRKKNIFILAIDIAKNPNIPEE